MFDRLASVKYAEKWALSFNSAYYNFSNIGGDCTNFVSQCLYAGKIAMAYSAYGWYYKNLNDRAPAWTGVEEFWNFGIKNNRNVGFKLTECTYDELELGDIVQLYNGAKYYHSLIVTKIEGSGYNKIVMVSAHDNPVLNVSVYSYGAYSYRCAKVSV